MAQSGELQGLLAGDIRPDAVAQGRQRGLDASAVDQLVRDYVGGLSV